MAEHPNASLVRTLYATLARGDRERLTALFHENVIWHVPGEAPLAGEHRGREAVFATMREFETRSKGTLRLHVHDVLAGEKHAVALLRATASRRRRRYDSLEIDMFHIRDGRVAEFWSFAQDQRLTDRFWA